MAPFPAWRVSSPLSIWPFSARTTSKAWSPLSGRTLGGSACAHRRALRTRSARCGGCRVRLVALSGLQRRPDQGGGACNSPDRLYWPHKQVARALVTGERVDMPSRAAGGLRTDRSGGSADVQYP